MTEVKIFDSMKNKEYWLNKIKQSDWGAGQFLYQLLSEGRLKKLCGDKTEVLMAVEGEEILAFCTYAEMDDVQPTDLTPWIGFVYTYPEHRGNRYAGLLLKHAEELAAEEGKEYVYISTNHIGLYEKYGYEFWEMQKDINGEGTRVYRKKVVGKY